jgi:predicted Zn-dependent protease
MGHEIAHAVAQHGGERMSQGLSQQLGGVALSVALKNEPATTQNLFLSAYGLGSTVGIMLPFSRTHESEADRLGLIFMAMAGYDPNSAVDFWTRMSQSKKGNSPPEFLSTHPSDETRIADLKKHMPEAMQYYKK